MLRCCKKLSPLIFDPTSPVHLFHFLPGFSSRPLFARKPTARRSANGPPKSSCKKIGGFLLGRNTKQCLIFIEWFSNIFFSIGPSDFSDGWLNQQFNLFRDTYCNILGKSQQSSSWPRPFNPVMEPDAETRIEARQSGLDFWYTQSSAACLWKGYHLPKVKVILFQFHGFFLGGF